MSFEIHQEYWLWCHETLEDVKNTDVADAFNHSRFAHIPSCLTEHQSAERCRIVGLQLFPNRLEGLSCVLNATARRGLPDEAAEAGELPVQVSSDGCRDGRFPCAHSPGKGDYRIHGLFEEGKLFRCMLDD